MKRILAVFLALGAVLGAVASSFAGSDRWIMAMTAQRMEQGNLVFVRLLRPDGAALESDDLKQIAIREQDCSSGQLFEVVKDYKLGYSPKNMLVGIYLPQHVWSGKTLCFSVPYLGRVVQGLDPSANNGRVFQLKMAP